jgi:threonine/homoserine/homoserine lactone efflux protein
MTHYLTLGILLGLSAGVAPGPLLALVISETIRHGIGSGVRVALAPMVTDLPIIILTSFILSKLSGFQPILGILALVGGCVIFYMGCDCLRTREVAPDLVAIKPKSLTKGIMANALSPHPYLFWFSVGAPTITKAMQQRIGEALAFVVGFYVFLVGSKIVLAVLVGQSKSFLIGRGYRYTMRFLGLVLCALSVVLFHDGLMLLGVVPR